MKVNNKLYRHTLVRVGPEKMKGIDRLLEEGHHGIAERHTVGKLLDYVKQLEQQLGINVPDPDKTGNTEGFIRVNQNGVSYLVGKPK